MHPPSLGLSRGHFYFAQRGHYHFAATAHSLHVSLHVPHVSLHVPHVSLHIAAHGHFRGMSVLLCSDTGFAGDSMVLRVHYA